jgi:hypothetical protein
MLSATFRYAVFALVAIAGPGIAIQRLARVAVDPALVLPLGIAATAAAYWLSLVLGFPWLYPLVIAAFVIAIFAVRAPGTLVDGPDLRGAVFPIVATIALLAVTQYGGNRVAPSGEFLLDNLVPYDTAFHVGLARELTLGYPPQLPGVSGFSLGYHLGPDLVRAAALRWAAVDPYDSINRFDVTLGAIALILILRAIVWNVGGYSARGTPRTPPAARVEVNSPLAAGDRFAVDLAGFIPLAADFSFLFAANPQAHWWVDLLRGNLLVSLALSNPVIPALALALGALVALDRDQGAGRGWLSMAAIQAAAVPFFKVFLGAHLLLGLAASALLGRRPMRDALVVALPCAVATALLVLGQGGRTVDVALAPLDLVRITRESLELPPVGGIALFGWAALWLAASLGLRLLGVGEACRALRRGPWSISALAVMALAAWPLGLLFRVAAPAMLEGQKTVNDAAYLIEQGGPMLWVFTVLALSTRAGARRAGRAVVVALAIVLALPATIQFAWKKARLPYDPVPAPMVRAMHALAGASRPGDVVLQRPGARYPPLPVVLIGRRVPYERFTPWLTQFAPRDALERRHEQVFRFFRTDVRAEAMAIAREMDARFVALYGADRLRFDTSGLLVPIYEDGSVRILEFITPPGGGDLRVR